MQHRSVNSVPDVTEHYGNVICIFPFILVPCYDKTSPSGIMVVCVHHSAIEENVRRFCFLLRSKR
jgi:hypothetical protein